MTALAIWISRVDSRKRQDGFFWREEENWRISRNYYTHQITCYIQITQIKHLSHPVGTWEGHGEELPLSDKRRVRNNLFSHFCSPNVSLSTRTQGKAFQLAVKCSVGSQFAALEHVASDMTGRIP